MSKEIIFVGASGLGCVSRVVLASASLMLAKAAVALSLHGMLWGVVLVGGEQVIERPNDVRTVVNEPVLKVDKAKNLTKLAPSGGLWKIVDNLHFSREWVP